MTAQTISKSLARLLAGSMSASIPAWEPSALSNLRQWALDGTGYHTDLVGGLPVLESKESYDTYRVPVTDVCPEFDGSTSFYGMDDPITNKGVTTLTVTAWIKTSYSGAYQTICGDWDDAGTEKKWRFGIVDYEY